MTTLTKFIKMAIAERAAAEKSRYELPLVAAVRIGDRMYLLNEPSSFSWSKINEVFYVAQWVATNAETVVNEKEFDK